MVAVYLAKIAVDMESGREKKAGPLRNPTLIAQLSGGGEDETLEADEGGLHCEELRLLSLAVEFLSKHVAEVSSEVPELIWK